MRVKRGGLCPCFGGGGTPLLDEDVLGGKAIEMTTKKESKKRLRAVSAPKQANDDLWRVVLGHLEIMIEMENLSAAGSAIGDEEGDYWDDEDEEYERPNPGGPQGPGLTTRFNEALERFGEANLTALDLETIVSRLRDRELPDAQVAMTLVDRVRDHLHESASTCDNVPKPPPGGKIVVVGDLHGHLNDLLRLLDECGTPSPQNMYLFNGDFVDRGIWGPEVLFYLYCLRLTYPTFVYLNRGNHETKFCTDRYGFANDLKHAYPADYEELYSRVLGSFDQIPLCHFVADTVFVAHGGLPEHSIYKRDLEKIKRGPFPMHGRSAKIRTFQALLWSDPRDQRGASSRGMGFHFSQDMTEEFLANNELKYIIRSHECLADGYFEQHDSLCKTVFSASNYDGENNASVVVINSNLEVVKGQTWNEPYGDEMMGDDARAGWKMQENSDKLALEALASRVRDDDRISTPPKKRALDSVTSLVFLNRASLLEKFIVEDESKMGRVSQESWRSIMGLCLRTPADFPWEGLGPYLYTAEEDGSIVYIDFLLRYDSPFSAWLANKWCDTVLDLVANRSIGYQALFKQLDQQGTGLLPFSSMRTLLHKVMEGSSKPNDSTEVFNEAVRNFSLFRKLDTDGTGKVNKQKFMAALSTYKVQTVSRNQDHKGNPLKEEVVSGSCLGMESRVCNRCALDIPKGEKVWTSLPTDYDLCRMCHKELGSQIFSTYIHMKTEEEFLISIQAQWECVEQGLRAVFKSSAEIGQLFTLVDKDGTGQVNHKNFVKHMGRALRKEPAFMEVLYSTLCQFVMEARFKTKASGPLMTKELIDAFVVKDRGEEAVGEFDNIDSRKSLAAKKRG